MILGACNPAFAHRALGVEPSIGLLLPCNIVVRASAQGTIVETIDPNVLVRFTGNEALESVVIEVARGLDAALAAVAKTSGI